MDMVFAIFGTSPTALNAGFSTITHVGGGTVAVSRPQYLEVSNVANGAVVIAELLFDELCGWTFDHWAITDLNGNVETVFQNPYRMMKQGDTAYNWLTWGIEAFGTYNGTGKIMVSYNDHSKVIRTASSPVRIFIDQ